MLILGLLNSDQFAEFIRLAGFSLADHFGARLKDAEQLSRHMRVAVQDSLACLAHHRLHARNHFIQLLFGFAQERAVAALDLLRDLLREFLGLTHYPAGRFQQFPVGLFQFLPTLFGLVAAGARNRQHAEFDRPCTIP
jgi:hypothetical protein